MDSAPAPSVKADANVVVQELRTLLHGSHACIAGSSVAAEQYGLPHAYDDLDIFAYSNSSLVAIAQHLMDQGFTFSTGNAEKVWDRWLAWDLNAGWKTNSLKLTGTTTSLPKPLAFEVNVVYKQFEKQPVRRLSDVLESFDFGLLAHGYDLRTGDYRDMRPYFFPNEPSFKRLPLLPERRARWESGLVTQYTGIRQAGRAVKYHGYGYDMSLVIPDLVTGYRIAAAHHADHFDPEKVLLAQVYDRLADHLEDGEFDKIVEADQLLPQWRDLDSILERLD